MMKQTVLIALGCAMVASAQPSVVSLSPLQGSGQTATFTSVYHHPQGRHYLAYLLVLPTPNVVQFVAKGSCLVEYNTYSLGVRLIDDAGTGWLGGASGVRGPVLTNNVCSVNTGLVQASPSTPQPTAPTLTVTVPVTFTGAFSGPLTTFLQERDADDRTTGMTQFGTWTAFPSAMRKPGPFISFFKYTPFTSGGLQRASVDLTFSHTGGLSRFNGTAHIGTAHVLIADSIVGGANRCHIMYFRDSDEIQLVNDAGTGFSPSRPRRFNSTCATGTGVNGDLLSSTDDGNVITLHIPVEYNPLYVTPNTNLNVWANVFDNQGNLTHWLSPGQ